MCVFSLHLSASCRLARTPNKKRSRNAEATSAKPVAKRQATGKAGATPSDADFVRLKGFDLKALEGHVRFRQPYEVSIA